MYIRTGWWTASEKSQYTPGGPSKVSLELCGCRSVVLGVSEIRNSEVCDKAVFNFRVSPGERGAEQSE